APPGRSRARPADREPPARRHPGGARAVSPGNPGSGGLLIWVTHLYGIGHLRRASAIARACRELGLAVTLVSGGRPLPFLAAELEAEGIRLVQLPPLHSPDASFAQLVDADGREADSGYLRERRRLLLDAFSAA